MKKPARTAYFTPPAYTSAQQHAAREVTFWRTRFLQVSLLGPEPVHMPHVRFRDGDLDDEQVGWLVAHAPVVARY